MFNTSGTTQPPIYNTNDEYPTNTLANTNNPTTTNLQGITVQNPDNLNNNNNITTPSFNNNNGGVLGSNSNSGLSTGTSGVIAGAGTSALATHEYDKHSMAGESGYNNANPKEFDSYGGNNNYNNKLYEQGYKQNANGLPITETVTLIDAVYPLTFTQRLAMALAQGFALASLVLMLVWLIVERGSLVWSTSNPKMINFHAFFGVVGVALFYFEGVIVHRLFSVNHVRGRIHIGLMYLLNLGCIAVCLYCAIALLSGPHFFSLHSWIGIIAAGFFLFQAIGALLTHLCPVGGDIGLVQATPYNFYFAYSSFVLGIVALFTGIQSYLSSLQTNGDFWPGANNGNNSAIGLHSTDAILGNVLGLCLLGLLLTTMYAVLPRYTVPTVERPVNSNNYVGRSSALENDNYNYTDKRNSINSDVPTRRTSWWNRPLW